MSSEITGKAVPTIETVVSRTGGGSLVAGGSSAERGSEGDWHLQASGPQVQPRQSAIS